MKWINTDFRLPQVNTAVKYIISLLAVFTLMSCLNMTEFHAANEVNRMDNNLSTLLIKESATNNEKERKEMSFLAAQAHESGDKMVKANHPRVAIAYYRMAAVAYWRDGEAANDEQLLNVIDTASGLCEALQKESKAPDRDCFIVQISTSLQILESKFEEIANINQANFNETNIAGVRGLLDQLGYQAEGSSAKSHGFFVKFISTIKKNASFLNKHPTMKGYIVDTLMDVSKQYKKSMDEVAAYYRRTNNETETASIETTHPLYAAILSQPGNTSNKRIMNMIDLWLAVE